MATGLGQTFRAALYSYLFRAQATPLPTNYFISLHTADPGTDGQTANEASGGAYARVSVTPGTGAFNAPTAANPNVMTNNGVITFPTATGAGYSSGAAMTFFGVWNHATNTAAANFVGRGSIASQSIVSGNIPSFATGQLSMTVNET